MTPAPPANARAGTPARPPAAGQSALRTRLLVLVEDDPGDAEHVLELLQDDERNRYEVQHHERLAPAIEQLRQQAVDVVVLDLRLPDSDGVDSVRRIHAVTADVPVVVLTGAGDDALADACLDAGAQDVLDKNELDARTLRRTIGYAISRLREQQLQQTRASLERYRALSSAAQRTGITGALVGSGSVAARHPDAFADAVRQYLAMLEPFLSFGTGRVEARRDDKERVVTTVGDAGGGPRDLLDVHVAALERALATHDDPRAVGVMFEARLLALEMMGLLVDYYRVGIRRRPATERPT